MQKTVYKIKKIEVLEFRPKESVSVIKISFTKNDIPEQIIKEFPMSNNPVEMVNKIMLEVKSQNRMIVEDTDDILQNIYITRIDNEEVMEEKMLLFFQNLCGKFSKMRSLTKAPDYMKLYDEIKTTKLVLG